MNKQRRRRGVILTEKGYNKIQQAKSETENRENLHKGYTLEALSFRTGLDPDTLMKIFACQVGVDKKSLNCCFKAFDLELEANDYQFPQIDQKIHKHKNPHQLQKSQIDRRKNNYKKVLQKSISFTQRRYKTLRHIHSTIGNKIDWGKAPDVSAFCGREQELEIAQKWMINDRCRVLLLLGMGGMGKTWLSVKLAQEVKDDFDFVIWRSLDRITSITDMLGELIHLFSKEQEKKIPDNKKLPDNIDARISLLISYFKSSRCLLILDNAETMLENISCKEGTSHNKSYAIYHKFLKLIAETSHQSCLLLTSREKPTCTRPMEGEKLPVRVLHLKGLQLKNVQQMCKVKCSLYGSDSEWERIIEYYGGNPLALSIVCTTIQQLFDGKISEFIKQNIFVYGEIRDLLQQHFDSLSDIEKLIIYWLSRWGEPASFSKLREHISPPISPQKLLEATESLQERSLVEKDGSFFSLQPLVGKYVNQQLKEKKITNNFNFISEDQKKRYNLQIA